MKPAPSVPSVPSIIPMLSLPPAPLDLCVIGGTQRAAAPFLEWHIRQAVKLCDSPLRELTVIVASDGIIRSLHQRFFNDPTVTDVITFPLEQDERGRALSGEIYFCPSVARRQAHLRHISIRHELLLYAVHGILHLCGHDDLSPRKCHAMHKEEDRILEALGLGPVFGRPELGVRRKPRLPPQHRR
jgi:probable rRNA maturation factor